MNAKVNMMDVAKQITLNVEVNNLRQFRLRRWLGFPFVRLGCWLMGINCAKSEAVDPPAEVATLNVKAGDVIILRYAGILSRYQREAIGKAMKDVFPKNQCVVFEENVSLHAVIKAESNHHE